MSDDPILPTMPSMTTAIDDMGHWLGALDQYFAAIDKLEPKLVVAEAAYGSIESMIRSVVLIPGTGEWGYEPTEVRQRMLLAADDGFFGIGGDGLSGTPFIPINKIAGLSKTDVMVALDNLQSTYPAIKNVSVVVSWFTNDLRAGSCTVKPMVSIPFDEAAQVDNRPWQWSVNGLYRISYDLISLITPAEGPQYAAYSSTPADRSVVHLIQELRRRGLAVTFYPFLLADIPEGNTLPNPFGGSSQPAYPWRGRITCDPAPGIVGTVDRTAAARSQIEAFVGACARTDLVQRPSEEDVSYSGPDEWGFRRFILHYAHLCALAGGVDAFLVGTELRGLTWVRDNDDRHPFVDALVTIAADVRAILPEAKISYGADWSEFAPYQTPEGGLDFHLDPLWSSPDIDAIGIDNYWPLSDWRGVVGIDEDAFSSIYDPTYLLPNMAAGEGYDWFYASDSDRISQVRTPITDGMGKPWVYRYKDIRNWWLNQHFNRSGGIESATPTAWIPQSKPFWMTETGCPAIDKGANQPNVFVDPKSSESLIPYFSVGTQDDLMQQRYHAAFHAFWSSEANNPKSAVYGGYMVDPERLYVYCWDARPFPQFPNRSLIENEFYWMGAPSWMLWGDSPNWNLGHWVTGRPAHLVSSPTTPPPGSIADIMAAKPMPKGEPAVDPKTGELNTSWHHYLAQIEQFAKRLQSLQIVAINDSRP